MFNAQRHRTVVPPKLHCEHPESAYTQPIIKVKRIYAKRGQICCQSEGLGCNWASTLAPEPLRGKDFVGCVPRKYAAHGIFATQRLRCTRPNYASANNWMLKRFTAIVGHTCRPPVGTMLVLCPLWFLFWREHTLCADARIIQIYIDLLDLHVHMCVC